MNWVISKACLHYSSSNLSDINASYMRVLGGGWNLVIYLHSLGNHMWPDSSCEQNEGGGRLHVTIYQRSIKMWINYARICGLFCVSNDSRYHEITSLRFIPCVLLFMCSQLFLFSIYLYSSLNLGHLFSFFILYAVGRAPWTQGRYLTQTQNKRTHPCLEWDPNPQSQRSSGRRRLIP
jgi:hypothetical protein